LLTGKRLSKRLSPAGKSCRVTHGSGKFTPSAAWDGFEKSLIYLRLHPGPALALRLLGASAGSVAGDFDAYQGVGHVSVGQFVE
jgi:hypothetical protein